MLDVSTMTYGQVITACLAAFGIGYAIGSYIRILRQGIEKLQ